MILFQSAVIVLSEIYSISDPISPSSTSLLILYCSIISNVNKVAMTVKEVSKPQLWKLKQVFDQAEECLWSVRALWICIQTHWTYSCTVYSNWACWTSHNDEHHTLSAIILHSLKIFFLLNLWGENEKLLLGRVVFIYKATMNMMIIIEYETCTGHFSLNLQFSEQNHA